MMATRIARGAMFAFGLALATLVPRAVLAAPGDCKCLADCHVNGRFVGRQTLSWSYPWQVPTNDAWCEEYGNNLRIKWCGNFWPHSPKWKALEGCNAACERLGGTCSYVGCVSR